MYPVKGYSITVNMHTPEARAAAPEVSVLDEAAKIVTSRLGDDRFRVAGTSKQMLPSRQRTAHFGLEECLPTMKFSNRKPQPCYRAQSLAGVASLD